MYLLNGVKCVCSEKSLPSSSALPRAAQSQLTIVVACPREGLVNFLCVRRECVCKEPCNPQKVPQITWTSGLYAICTCQTKPLQNSEKPPNYCSRRCGRTILKRQKAASARPKPPASHKHNKPSCLLAKVA